MREKPVSTRRAPLGNLGHGMPCPYILNLTLSTASKPNEVGADRRAHSRCSHSVPFDDATQPREDSLWAGARPGRGRTAVALDKRDRLSPLESSQAAAVGTGDLAGPGVRHVAPLGTACCHLPCPDNLLHPARNLREPFEHPWPLSERYRGYNSPLAAVFAGLSP